MGAGQAAFFVTLALASTLALALQLWELRRLGLQEKKLLKRRGELKASLKVRLEELEYLHGQCPDWATKTRKRLEEEIARIRKVLA